MATPKIYLSHPAVFQQKQNFKIFFKRYPARTPTGLPQGLKAGPAPNRRTAVLTRIEKPKNQITDTISDNFPKHKSEGPAFSLTR
jgi:hypothetical protein